VLLPNDPDSYYADRELVPGDMLDDVHQIGADFKARVDRGFDAMLTRAGGVSTKVST
jgi:hypothetical protein